MMTNLRPVSFFTYPNPAAGAGVSELVDPIAFTDAAAGATAGYLITAVFATLTTDANVANRRLELAFRSPSNITYVRVSSPVDQAASLAVDYSWSPRGSDQTAIVNTHLSLAIPQPLIVRGDYVLRLDIAAVQVGDQLSNVRLQVVNL